MPSQFLWPRYSAVPQPSVNWKRRKIRWGAEENAFRTSKSASRFCGGLNSWNSPPKNPGFPAKFGTCFFLKTPRSSLSHHFGWQSSNGGSMTDCWSSETTARDGRTQNFGRARRSAASASRRTVVLSMSRCFSACSHGGHSSAGTVSGQPHARHHA